MKVIAVTALILALSGSSLGRSEVIPSIPANCVFITNVQTASGGEYSYIDPLGSLVTIKYEVGRNGEYNESRKVVQDYASGHSGSGAQLNSVNAVIGQVIREIEIQITTTIQEVLRTTNVNAPSFQASKLVQVIVKKLRPIITSTVKSIISQSGLNLNANDVVQNVIVQIEPSILQGIQVAIGGSSGVAIGGNRPGYKPAGALNGRGEISTVLIDQLVAQLRPVIAQIVNQQTKISCQNHSSGSIVGISAGSARPSRPSSGSSRPNSGSSRPSSGSSRPSSGSSRPSSGSSRPTSGSSRPTSGTSRPSRPSSGSSRPTSGSSRPTSGTSRPSRPSSGSSRPTSGSSRPTSETSRPSRPSSGSSRPTSGSSRPTSGTSRPSRPSSGTSRPSTGTVITSRPSSGSSRPSRPSSGSSQTSRPSSGSSSSSVTGSTSSIFGSSSGSSRPSRPSSGSSRPTSGTVRPSRPSSGSSRPTSGIARPSRPSSGSSRPTSGTVRPSRPSSGSSRPSRPSSGTVIPSRPSSGTARPSRPSSGSSRPSSGTARPSRPSSGSSRPSSGSVRPSRPSTGSGSFNVETLTNELVEIIVLSLKGDIQTAVLQEIRAHSENDDEVLADAILTTLRPSVIQVIRRTVNSNAKFAGFKSDIESLTTRILSKLRPIILGSIKAGLKNVREQQTQQGAALQEELINTVVSQLEGGLQGEVDSELQGYSGSLANVNKQSLVNAIVQRLRSIILSTLKNIQRRDSRFSSFSSSSFNSLVDQIIQRLQPLILQYIEQALQSFGLEGQFVDTVASQVEGQIQGEVNAELQGYSGSLSNANKQSLLKTVMQRLRPIILSTLKSVQRSDSRFSVISSSRFNALVDLILQRLRALILQYIESGIQQFASQGALLDELVQLVIQQLNGEIQNFVIIELKGVNNLNNVNTQRILNAVMNKMTPLIRQTIQTLIRTRSEFSVFSSQIDTIISQVLAALRPVILEAIQFNIDVLKRQQPKPKPQPTRPVRPAPQRPAGGNKPTSSGTLTELFGISGDNNVVVETPNYNYQYAIPFAR